MELPQVGIWGYSYHHGCQNYKQKSLGYSWISPVPMIGKRCGLRLLELAAREAHAHNSSSPQAVERLLRVMAENWRLSTQGRTPLTDSLRGCLPLASKFGDFVDALQYFAAKEAGNVTVILTRNKQDYAGSM
jgi:hypothetical protein